MAQVRSWTQKKLRLLEKYLGVYMTIMDAQRRKGRFRRVVYIDAFAGPGRYDDESGDQQKYLEGSPFRALKIPKPFDEYWFIEKDAARAQRLRENLEADPETTGLLAEGKIRIFCKDANEVLRGDACAGIRYKDYARALVFLDPYGLEVAFATVEALAEARAFELFINFSVMGVNRLLKRQGGPEDWAKDQLDRVFGDRSWEDFYTHGRTLFGDPSDYRGEVPAQRVAELYRKRLSSRFEFVSEPKIMRNSTDAPLYALMLASHSPVAKKLMDYLVRLSST
jgi:three-Cys-motif partner protein